MSSEALKENKLLFVPKVQDAAFLSYGISFPMIMMDAHHVEWHKKAAAAVKNSCEVFVIDPVTHRLVYKDAQKTKSFAALPYPKNIDIEEIYSNATLRIDSLVKPVIDYQIQNGADIIIPPYLFAETTDDSRFTLNLTLLADTINYLSDNEIDLPVFAMITAASYTLSSPAKVNYIVDRYLLDFENKLGGFFILIDGINYKKSDPSELFGLAKMVYQLSKTGKVFVKRIGAFGEILCSLGATGFISGINTAQSFNVQYLEDEPEGFKRLKKTYVPEIFDYLNDEAIKVVGYKCDCNTCNGSCPISHEEKSKHFLSTRIVAVNEIEQQQQEKKIKHTLKKIKDGKTLLTKWSQEHQLLSSASHLNTWETILENARYWERKSSESSFTEEELLREIEGVQNSS